MKSQIPELNVEELDRVSGGMDIGGAMSTVATVALGLVTAGLNGLTGGTSGGGSSDGPRGGAPRSTWL